MDFTRVSGRSGLNLFWLVSVLLVFLLAGFFAYFFIASQQYNHTNLDKLQASIQLHINRRLQYEVNDAIHFIDARYNSAEQVIMAQSQKEVLQALEVMNSFYQQNRRRLSDVALKKQLLEVLRGVRFLMAVVTCLLVIRPAMRYWCQNSLTWKAPQCWIFRMIRASTSSDVSSK